MSDERCVRCTRAAPEWGDPDYSRWECVGTSGEMICPGCLTGFEQREIDDEAMDIAAEVLGSNSHRRDRGGWHQAAGW